MSWALIFVIYTQSAQSLAPHIDRLEISPQRMESAQACDAAGQLLRGPLLAETDPARQYSWQDYQCVLLK
jgi:hypothetical protein